MIHPGRSFPDEEALGDGNEVKFTSTGINAGYGDDLRQSSLRKVDPRTPLLNLSMVRQKMDALQQFLSESVSKNTLIGKDQMDMVSTEISSAIHQIIVNGAALLACSQCESLGSQAGEDRFPRNGKYPDQVHLGASTSSLMSGIVSDLLYPIAGIDSLTSVATSKAVESVDPTTYRITCSAVENWEKSTVSPDYIDCSVSEAKASNQSYPRIPISYLDSNQQKDVADLKLEPEEEDMKDEINHVSESEIVELDAVELLAEHVHVCEICGKGFKRDANLRMHMRAHGDKFKTMEALSKPETITRTRRRTRFSCPFVGCNRNKSHKKFRPLKSAICVKNHFKRSHCAKMFACDRCHKKSFSVVSDLKSHLKHCGESKWRCSCGTSFSRKDKLFGHMALFEGHMPAIAEEDEKPGGALTMEKEEEEEEEEEQAKEKIETQMDGVPTANFPNHESYGSLFDILGEMVDDGSKDFLEYPSFDMMMNEFFEFQ